MKHKKRRTLLEHCWKLFLTLLKIENFLCFPELVLTLPEVCPQFLKVSYGIFPAFDIDSFFWGH